MFTSSRTATDKELVDDLRSARERRAQEKLNDRAATIIQRFIRRYSGKVGTLKALRTEFNTHLTKEDSLGVDLYFAGRILLFLDRNGKDFKVFDEYGGRLVASMETKGSVKRWYVSVALNKTHSVSWIQQVKMLLLRACSYLKDLQPGEPHCRRRVSLYLQMLTIFTDYTLWKMTAKVGEAMKPLLLKMSLNIISHLVDKGMYSCLNNLLLNGLGCPSPGLNALTLPAAMALRCLSLCAFPSQMLTVFILNVMTAPALVLHLQNISPQTCQQLKSVGFVQKCLRIFDDSKSLCVVLSSVDGNQALCLLSNVVQLVFQDKENMTPENQDTLLMLLRELLEVCYSNRSQVSKSSQATWHPVFGWTQQKSDERFMDAMSNVIKQLQLLWKKEFVSFLFSPLFAVTPAKDDRPTKPASTMSRFTRFRLLLISAYSSNKLPSNVEKRILNVCSYFQLSIRCLPDSRMDILTGIICHGDVIPKLWCFLGSLTQLSPEEVSRAIAEPKSAQMLDAVRLFCQVTSHLIAILDDSEFYEKEEPFKLSDLTHLSQLLNNIAFHLIWKVPKSTLRDEVLTDCLLLLHVLYDRDNRRPFCPQGFWLIKDLKFSTFLNEFKHGKERAKELITNLPHIMPHRHRVELFRERVQKDKRSLGIVSRGDLPTPSTYIKIRRSRLLEDGHDELSALPPVSLKSVIKVKFVNEQGLDEAGIDEHGVFKEFLEEIIAKAFNPDLSLFKTSSDGRLYPSSTSYVNPNHLLYFEFMGKLLGKAVYEGIVVDLPFASFFLRQVLGHHHRTLYSPYDELSSMDADLHRSLQSVKNYEGDVLDLDLAFTWDVEHLGKLTTHNLKEGGSVIDVSNDNKISYIHLVAQFHLFTQIKAQSAAFVTGFRSIIPREWTSCFSALELQRLISGDDVDLDVDDLKRHTVYYGGYHSGHRVISWLWDVLKNDFKRDEQALFLKFVTSCSRPPLLGFDNLHPKFTIRLVEVADDEDRGDTVFSVVKGLFAVRGKKGEDRLPTASTCFNLLKLPNYSKKAVLREKLRYSIHAHAGFELS